MAKQQHPQKIRPLEDRVVIKQIEAHWAKEIPDAWKVSAK